MFVQDLNDAQVVAVMLNSLVERTMRDVTSEANAHTLVPKDVVTSCIKPDKEDELNAVAEMVTQVSEISFSVENIMH